MQYAFKWHIEPTDWKECWGCGDQPVSKILTMKCGGEGPDVGLLGVGFDLALGWKRTGLNWANSQNVRAWVQTRRRKYIGQRKLLKTSG
jgi:hypothetical protein